MMIIITLIVFVIDIISKLLVVNFINYNESIHLIGSFLSFTYVKNYGAAWSIFYDRSYLVTIISLLIILAIVYYLIKNKPKKNMEKIAYSLILGGAFGNFVNRIIYGYVVDFIDIKIFNYDYPIFNLADSFIVVGVLIMIIYTWRCNKNGDSSIRE